MSQSLEQSRNAIRVSDNQHDIAPMLISENANKRLDIFLLKLSAELPKDLRFYSKRFCESFRGLYCARRVAGKDRSYTRIL